MTAAILFDRDQVDHLDELSQMPSRLRGSKLLWVDLVDRSDAELDGVGEAFGLERSTLERLASPRERAVFEDYGRYIHVTTYSPCEDSGALMPLECVVGQNWVVTAHDRPVAVLEDFADRVSGSGNTGVLDGPAFLATLLEWVLGAYTAAFERVEENLEELAVEAMRGKGDANSHIDRLVSMRRQVGELRRALSAHRSALVALTHPELDALSSKDSGERFQSLLRRFESTVQEARDARDSVTGSFEVLIARTGHRTNEIMKILTLTSVIFLPGALLAGAMGMNFEVGLFEQPWGFYVVVALIVAIAPVTIAAAKVRHWI